MFIVNGVATYGSTVTAIDEVTSNDTVLSLSTQITALTASNTTSSANTVLIKEQTDKIPTEINKTTLILNRVADTKLGKRQVLTVPITDLSDAGSTLVATITAQACTIEKVILTADGVTTADLTSAAIKGGAADVIEFISAATAVTASINAADEQVSYDGGAVIPATGTINIDLQGGGSTAVALKVIIVYFANVDGGYLV